VDGRKVAIPWPQRPDIEQGFADLENPAFSEVWDFKSRQVFKSWEKAGFCAAKLITVPGWKGAVQSEVEHKSVDFKERAVYILEHLSELFDGLIHYTNTKRALTIHEVCGIEMRSSLQALAEGESQWRFEALSLAILDEATKIKDIARAYTAADSCIDTTQGGKIAVIFTSVPGTWPNREIEEMMERAIEMEEAA
jgi:hypothetical protein